MKPARQSGGRRVRDRLVAVLSLVPVLASPGAPRGDERFRVHEYVQWIAGSKMVLFTDDGVSMTLDPTEVDQSAYRGVIDGDGVTVEGVIRRPPTLGSNSNHPAGEFGRVVLGREGRDHPDSVFLGGGRASCFRRPGRGGESDGD